MKFEYGALIFLLITAAISARATWRLVQEALRQRRRNGSERK